MLAWTFFRSPDILSAYKYLYNLFINFDMPDSNRSGLMYVLAMASIDWILRKDETLSKNFKKIKMHYIFCIILCSIIILFKSKTSSTFIYFQF